jgi:hypothetical protein
MTDSSSSSSEADVASTKDNSHKKSNSSESTRPSTRSRRPIATLASPKEKPKSNDKPVKSIRVSPPEVVKGDKDVEGEVKEIGDLVWVKYSSYPWWPATVCPESDCPPDVRKKKKDGSVLVVFLGQPQYAWVDKSNIRPFEVHFAEFQEKCKNKNGNRAICEAIEVLALRKANANVQKLAPSLHRHALQTIRKCTSLDNLDSTSCIITVSVLLYSFIHLVGWLVGWGSDSRHLQKMKFKF